jgi:hypothetical protein
MTSRTTAMAITVGALLFSAGVARANDMDNAFLKFLAQHGVKCGIAWRWLMADRRTAAPAAAHGVARRLLVFKLPDQLALGFADGAGDVRVLSDRY